MRLIDADALMSKAHDIHIKEVGYRHRCIDIEDVRTAPTIEAEPVKTGKWIEDDDPTMPSHCSACGEYALEWVETRYCPNCGAKLEREE